MYFKFEFQTTIDMMESCAKIKIQFNSILPKIALKNVGIPINTNRIHAMQIILSLLNILVE